MSRNEQLDVIAHECVDVNERIQAHGTDTMKMLMRLLLLEIGHEIASQQHRPTEQGDGG